MGFYNGLNNFLIGEVNAKIPMHSRQHLPTEGYFNKREKITDKLLEETNWLEHWNKNNILLIPQEADKQELNQFTLLDGEYLKTISNYELANIMLCLIFSLKQLIHVDLEKSNTAKQLWQYYQWAKTENNNRPDTQHLPEDVNEFKTEIQLKNTQTNKKTNTEELRKNGSACIFCNSNNVRSYNTQLWKCYNCKKQFRKH